MIAVSFCNQPDDAGGILALLDERTDERRWLDCGDLALQSGVGLAEADGLLYCACTDGDASYLAIFDASGTRRELRRLDAVSDIHSICIDGDDLFAVSTGTDEVVRHSLRTGAPPETVWSPSQAGADTHHLNAVIRRGDALLVSGFGPRAGATWSTARDGYIYDVASSRYLKRGLLHPHSLVSQRGILYFCESSRRSVRTLEGDRFVLDGYARGLAFGADGALFAGSSVGRRGAGDPALVLNPADAGSARGRCTVSAFTEGRSRTYDVSDLGDEVYDLLALGR